MGGGLLAALSLPPARTAAQDGVDISMTGRRDGSRVWFDPIGIRIRVGQTVRWTNRDDGNSHTATAYHSANFSRPLRIPRGSEPWDSGYLLPGASFQAMLTVPGVYDYYCIPHEMAGMVGRIVVGEPSPDGMARSSADDELPEAALRAFPSVEEIMTQGVVRRS
jgi:plastocyanin